MLYTGKIKRIEPNIHPLRKRWEIVGNKMRGRCDVPKKTSPTRESLWMRKHINDKFFGLQLECQLPITVTDVGQRRE